MLYVAYKQGEAKSRKLTAKQQFDAEVEYLRNKWEKRDAMNAERDLERIMKTLKK